MAKGRMLPPATPSNHPKVTFAPLQWKEKPPPHIQSPSTQSPSTNSTNPKGTHGTRYTKKPTTNTKYKRGNDQWRDYKSMYDKDFKVVELGEKLQPHPHSPTRLNRPHPTHLRHLARLGKSSDSLKQDVVLTPGLVC